MGPRPLPTLFALALGVVSFTPAPGLAQYDASPPEMVEAEEGADPKVKDLPPGTIYYWYDATGQLHATDELGMVPPEHRGAARDRAGALPDGSKTQLSGGAQSGGAASPGAPTAKGEDASDTQKDKAYWQGLIQETQARLDEAEARLKEVDAELVHVRATRPPGFHETLAKLAEERTQLEATIKEAQEALQTGIADRARKAGAPPGWLR